MDGLLVWLIGTERSGGAIRLTSNNRFLLFRRSRGVERPQVSDQSAGARREESCSGAAMSGVQGRVSAPEDGAKASERSFSGANWL